MGNSMEMMDYEWQPNMAYNYGDIVCFNRQKYQCIRPHVGDFYYTPDYQAHLWNKIG